MTIPAAIMEICNRVKRMAPGERLLLSNEQITLGGKDLAAVMAEWIRLGKIVELPRTGDAAKYQKLWPR